jgi:predicted hydrolase (HD superfamily)
MPWIVFLPWITYYVSTLCKGSSMPEHVPTRDEAWELLNEFNSNESLIKHALAVEGVMRYMAEKSGEHSEKWGIVGLVHDLDYERFPERHCAKSGEILEDRGWPGEYIRAVVSHGWGLCSDVEPLSQLEKTLYAVDELVGFVTACALVRPSKSVMDMDVKSVQKKWKQKSFAAGVNREVIEKGAELLGMELGTLISEVIAGMRLIAPAIGL